MDPDLKHALRTPLNHILGFCEMLIEEAADDTNGVLHGRVALVRDLERIHEVGRRLPGAINLLFDEAGSPAGSSLIDHEILTPLRQIVDWTGRLGETAIDFGDDAGAADIAKIRFAAQHLLELVELHFPAGRATADATVDDASPAIHLLLKDAEVPDSSTALSLPGSILIADDDAANREMLARRLRRLGHTVAIAPNGRIALEMIQAHAYDLLLLDMFMPEMDGEQVLRHLQAHHPAARLPVIVLSASEDSGKVAHAITLGAQDYLPKPFDPALLRARISSCLETKRLHDREAAYLATIRRERDRSDELLRVILPAEVAAELKARGEVRPRRVENVAVLFADIAGFTRYCDSRDPETVHHELQSLVQALEEVTAAHGMEKIKTIGDSFLATSGLMHPNPGAALDGVRCGLAMIHAARALPAAWELRVGVHCGPLVAGIVGRQKYQYDIWGDTVNTAARVQSEAPVGGLCVNPETWSLLESRCTGRSLGLRELKGKGPQELFEIDGIRD